MGKSTAAGNVTAEEFTTPTVVRDAIGRDHIVGPMGNMDDVERQRRELDEAGKGEQRQADPEPAVDKRADDPKSTGETAGKPSAATLRAASQNSK